MINIKTPDRVKGSLNMKNLKLNIMKHILDNLF